MRKKLPNHLEKTALYWLRRIDKAPCFSGVTAGMEIVRGSIDDSWLSFLLPHLNLLTT